MIERNIAQAQALYARLADHVRPEKNGTGGRRVPPSSRPLVRVEIVSAMAELERFTAWWIGEARELLGDRYRQNGQGDEPPP
jgi:hypothetical protein